MTMRRMFMMAGGAVIPVAVVALLFDNQWVVDAIRESDFEFDEGIGPLVSWSQTLAWRFTPSDGMEWSFVLVTDFSVLLFFVLLAVLVVGGARIIDPARGPFGAVLVGWWAAIIAGAVAGLIYGPLAYWTLDLTSASRVIFTSISQGATAGMAFGWLAGLGALGGFAISRPQTAGAQQPYGAQRQYAQQQPYAPQQPGMPMQQPMPQQPMQQQMPQHMQQQGMPQQPMQPHPSAVPYVPPQGQPQQQWGAAPVPQQPGAPGQQPGAPSPQQPGVPGQQPGTPVPQQFGAPPVPPQQPPQPAPAAPPAAERAEPETAADDPEPAEPEAGTGTGPETPRDTPDNDDLDLDLADRTIVDRGRTDD